MHEPASARPALAVEAPARCQRPGLLGFLAYLSFALFFVLAFSGTQISPTDFISGLPNMARVLGDMYPPSTARLASIGVALLETFQMALVGTIFGVMISLPLAVLSSRTHSPHPALYHATRALISLFRTVPDLVWALFFVATVGLGPFAGTLALTVDTVGFCGRFFAEAMEETDPGPQEALTALGARRLDVVFGAVVPAAMPSFIATSLFSLEKATRSSVVLGLVGAGGIGIELKVAMDMFEYDQAATIIICVFLLVLVVERGSAMLRRRIL